MKKERKCLNCKFSSSTLSNNKIRCYNKNKLLNLNEVCSEHVHGLSPSWEKILKNDLRYSCEYEIFYDDKKCECDDGICRCSKIDYVEIKSAKSVIEYLLNLIKDKKGEMSYAFLRLLIHYKVYDEHNLYSNIKTRYYGDELDSITIDNSIVQKIINDMLEIEKMESLDEIIKYLLIKEYGYLLPELENTKFFIQKIYKNNICYSNSHYRKLNKDFIDFYSSFECDFPQAIILKEKNNYRLIDGYHRFMACKKSEILVFCGETKL